MIARFHCIIVLQLSTPPMAPSPAKNFARMSRGCGFQTRLGHIQAGVRWLITPPKSALATRRRKLPEMSPKLWDKERSMDAAARHLGITFSKPALSPTPAADRKTELDTEIARLRARIKDEFSALAVLNGQRPADYLRDLILDHLYGRLHAVRVRAHRGIGTAGSRREGGEP